MAGVMDTVSRLDELPALPETLVKIPPMLVSGDYDTVALCEIIRRDEALAAAVLKRANSALFNASGATFDLDQSIIRLGSKELMALVTRAGADSVLRDAGASYGLRRGQLARSAAGGASVAALLAKDENTVDPSMAYVCALLRDIGKIVMDLHVGPGSRVLDETVEAEPGACFLEIERERHGADHARIGSELAEMWSLPAPIPSAIAYHHAPPAPDSDDHDALFDIVHAADIITLWAGLAIGTDGLAYRVAAHVRDGILADRERAERLISHAWDEAAAFENAMHDTGHAGEASA